MLIVASNRSSKGTVDEGVGRIAGIEVDVEVGLGIGVGATCGAQAVTIRATSIVIRQKER